MYIAALENYQRLYEAQPAHIIDSAKAERERMQAETDKIIAETAQRIAKIEVDYAESAKKAGEQVAKSLIENVNKAIVNRSEKALLREHTIIFITAFTMIATAVIFSSIIIGNVEFITRSYAESSNFFIRLALMIWNAPAGLVIFVGCIAVTWSYFTEMAALRAAKRQYDRQP